MSRIGFAPINIENGVEISVSKGNLVTIKGPKGELHQQLDPAISIEKKDGSLTVARATEQKRHKSLHGLTRALIANMVEGVTKGYETIQELHGVGYRAANNGQLLELTLGFSHPIYFYVPDEVKVDTKMEKGKPPTIFLSSHDKQLIGQVAAKIRAFRRPEPYKGKGIRFKGEVIRRKQGKTAG